ncbi:NUDIX domain-containing protein [Stackebrandtia soli]|uniref:NUDIX domain-containing protein n=1 Tax=Stackebrandtia soli TaxID=1892856 RepID=UPI0039E78269
MAHEYTVEDSRTVYSGFFDVVNDRVAMPGGDSADRVYLRHPGAVAVVALDDAGRVLLVRQYRAPVGRFLWELPAGLRDVDGEDPSETARRELAEEADLLAGSMEPLLDVFASPGCSDERIQIYLARGLTAVPSEQAHTRTHEEAELETRWWDLDEALAAIADGRIRNNICVSGLLAAAQSR